MFEVPQDLSKELQSQILADRAAGRLHPRRCPDEAALRRHNRPGDQAAVWRPAFVRDCEKVLHTPAYNRYAGKTQVFSFCQNDDITRWGLSAAQLL